MFLSIEKFSLVKCRVIPRINGEVGFVSDTGDSEFMTT